jgi:hypothetical protein
MYTPIYYVCCFLRSHIGTSRPLHSWNTAKVSAKHQSINQRNMSYIGFVQSNREVFRWYSQYTIQLCLLNDKEFCFSLIGLNSLFSTLPQSEYTSREVYSGLCLFLSIVYSVFQRCPTRDEISFPVG